MVKRRRSVTRERLLEAAAEVFAERGIVAARVEDVCERAGYTRGAFYSNFASKDDLLVALLGREDDQMVARLTPALASIAEHGATLGQVAVGLFEAQPFGTSSFLLRAELALLAVRDPQLAAPYLAARQALRVRLVPLLLASLQTAGLRLTIPPEDALDTLEALFESSIRSGAMDGDPNAPDNLASRVVPRIIEAITEPLPTSIDAPGSSG